MGKKILLLGVLFLSLIGGYGLVFGGTLVFSAEIKFLGASSHDVYLDNKELSSTIVIYESNSDISAYSVSSSCEVESEFLESYKSLYFFSVKYLSGETCKNGNIILEYNDEKIIPSLTRLELKNYNSSLGILVDYSSEDLSVLLEEVKKEIKTYGIYKNFTGENIANNYKYVKGKRKYLEANYQKEMIERILTARENKYAIPVIGAELSTKFTKMPNSPRPYRAGYTDGIHHGWDFDSHNNAQTISLDDGIVIRVVANFDDSDFSRIVYGENLSYEQELKNLDILRGKQVWVKTMKGDVAFYSHLADIESTIEEGMFIKRGQKVGTVGVSGVPEIGYDDYHLHFPIMQNPYDKNLAGTYDYGEYMAWDWIGKDLSYNEVITLQNNTFE